MRVVVSGERVGWRGKWGVSLLYTYIHICVKDEGSFEENGEVEKLN